MSQFASKEFDGHNYDTYRPDYNPEFYNYLLAYHQRGQVNGTETRTILDVGAGPGTATFQMERILHDNFDKVIGTDVSPVMVDTANSKLKIFNAARSAKERAKLEFSVSSCMDLSEHIQGKVDMVTAAEAAHYFLPFKDFLKEAKKVLKPHGTLAVWGYMDPSFVEYPEFDVLIQELQYGKKSLGDYCDQPGVTVMRNLLDAQRIDESDGFYDIECEKFYANDFRKNNKKGFPLIMQREMTITQFKMLITTWSTVSKRESVLHDTETIINNFFEKMFSLALELDWDTQVTVVWNSVYKFARNKG
ncbi:hypothetical protein ACO0RG_000003 [Hanseniaspora osmophila]